MRKRTAALGSAGFFLIAPGLVAGVVPWWLTRWQLRQPLPHWAVARVAGAALIAAAVTVLVDSFGRFVIEGGTPAPVAPTDRLVIRGPYRHVRNPMYVAVLAIIVGQALLLGRVILVAYAAAVWAAFSAFAHWHEEPALRRRFGAQYESYRRAVPAWLPRWRPWESGEPEAS